MHSIQSLADHCCERTAIERHALRTRARTNNIWSIKFGCYSRVRFFTGIFCFIYSVKLKHWNISDTCLSALFVVHVQMPTLMVSFNETIVWKVFLFYTASSTFFFFIIKVLIKVLVVNCWCYIVKFIRVLAGNVDFIVG